MHFRRNKFREVDYIFFLDCTGHVFSGIHNPHFHKTVCSYFLVCLSHGLSKQYSQDTLKSEQHRDIKDVKGYRWPRVPEPSHYGFLADKYILSLSLL